MEKRIFERTDGIRAKVGEEPLTPKTIRQLGIAISKYLNNQKILIARDTRESGAWIAQELKAGLTTSGAHPAEVGIIPTPALALLTKLDQTAAAGIMVTASHNPASDNGVKIFQNSGDKITDSQELEIESIFFGGQTAPTSEPPATSISESSAPTSKAPTSQTITTPTTNTAATYSAELRKIIGNSDLSAYKIYTDTAAGAAHSFIKEVANAFKVQTTEIGPTPTGQNINMDCGSNHPENLASTMTKNPLDLGVALDGDGDRIILVDETGRTWDGDRIIAMLATHLKSQNRLPNNTTILTEYSNLGAIQYLEQNGIKVQKVENGDREVLKKCRATGAHLGGEVAGHIIYTPWLSSSDGLMVALLTLSIMKTTGKKLSDLWPAYQNLPSKQWGLTVRNKPPLNQIPSWEAELANQTNLLGTTGRIFVRYSGTEPKLRILVEATDAAKMEQIGEHLSKIIQKAIGR